MSELDFSSVLSARALAPLLPLLPIVSPARGRSFPTNKTHIYFLPGLNKKSNFLAKLLPSMSLPLTVTKTVDVSSSESRSWASVAALSAPPLLGPPKSLVPNRKAPRM